jgi:hypothetical protein
LRVKHPGFFHNIVMGDASQKLFALFGAVAGSSNRLRKHTAPTGPNSLSKASIPALRAMAGLR